jgi:hypothetical protein
MRPLQCTAAASDFELFHNPLMLRFDVDGGATQLCGKSVCLIFLDEASQKLFVLR